MANLRITNVSQQAAADAVLTQINTGGAGTLKLYSGTQPADADDAITGTLLATLTFSATAFAAADATGTATANSITDETSATAGTVTHARIANGSGTTIFDCDVGEAADSATITIGDKVITSGAVVPMNALTITMPSGV